jgi:ABC-type glycerol-3-phosphate transport system permease component
MNPTQRRLIIIYLVTTAFLISLAWTNFSHTSASTNQNIIQVTVNIADHKFKETFAMVREAEAAGAESAQIKDFVDRLNLALNLTDEAEATTIIDQIKAEASQLRDNASLRSFYNKIFVFAMVPVAALIVTICTHYVFERRQSKVEQIMKMKIKEKRSAPNV